MTSAQVQRTTAAATVSLRTVMSSPVVRTCTSAHLHYRPFQGDSDPAMFGDHPVSPTSYGRGHLAQRRRATGRHDRTWLPRYSGKRTDGWDQVSRGRHEEVRPCSPAADSLCRRPGCRGMQRPSNPHHDGGPTTADDSGTLRLGPISHPTADLPPARERLALVCDPSTSRVILFGVGDTAGISTTPGPTTRPPTSGRASHPPAVVPSARMDHSMAYASAGGRVILFGGQGDSGYLNDTWACRPHHQRLDGAPPHGRSALRTLGSVDGLRLDRRRGDPLRGHGGGEEQSQRHLGLRPHHQRLDRASPHRDLPSARFWHSMVYDSAGARGSLWRCGGWRHEC